MVAGSCPQEKVGAAVDTQAVVRISSGLAAQSAVDPALRFPLRPSFGLSSVVK
jgi:hypothetical protein